MYIFLIIWLLFVFAYVIFNVYGIYRIMAMRIKGDSVIFAVLVYLIVMFVIIAISIIIIANLDWGKNLKDVLRF